MAQILGPELTQRIIELITPFMDDKDRHVYIDPWCIGFPKLHKQIDWTGAAQAFTIRVVRLFMRHGFVTRDKTAIEFLLESVHDGMGVGDQKEINAILHEMRKPKAGPPPRPQSTEPSSNRRSCTLTLIFASIVFSAIALVVWFGILPVLPDSTPAPTLTATSAPIQSATPTKLLIETSVVVQTPTMIIVLRPTSTSQPAEISTAVPPTATSTPMAPTPTNTPIVEPTVPSILTATSTPIAVSPATPVCLSIIEYHDENALEEALIEKAGFSRSDNLVFDNGDTFAEVCVTRE